MDNNKTVTETTEFVGVVVMVERVGYVSLDLDSPMNRSLDTSNRIVKHFSGDYAGDVLNSIKVFLNNDESGCEVESISIRERRIRTTTEIIE